MSSYDTRLEMELHNTEAQMSLSLQQIVARSDWESDPEQFHEIVEAAQDIWVRLQVLRLAAGKA